MNTANVIEVCQQLTDEGKQPSVALIKPRLAQPLPMPTIIAGLKSFKANPKQKVPTNITGNESSATPLTLEQRVAQLESEVTELKSLIAKLQASSAE
ncbi:MAG: hypothetical protein HWE10_05785 [Gammaproteobacteria bacterium]|nr:hypothetical protein [Gammaproteobacteria bacterium]